MVDLGRLRLCFVAGTLGQGGAERQLFYILKALRRAGANLRLLSLTKGEVWEHRIEDLGVPVTWVGQDESRSLRLARIIRELRRQPPDVLQSQHFFANLYVVVAARMLGLQEIGAVRNDANNEVLVNGAVLGSLSLRLPRLLAVNSRAGLQNAVRLGVPTVRLHLLPNVVAVEQFAVGPRQAGEPIHLLTVGRLVEQKRIDRFLLIVARFRERWQRQVKATIVGEGPLRTQLDKQAIALNLGPDVVAFRGSVSDMRSVYQEADVFLLTSDWEGTPNVMLEAMASGLPVVATRVGGVPEIVQHGETGFLAERDDQEALVEALLRLANDPQLRRQLGSRAREFVETNRSLDRLPAFLQALYDAALS